MATAGLAMLHRAPDRPRLTDAARIETPSAPPVDRQATRLPVELDGRVAEDAPADADESLMARVQAGDVAAFQLLVRRHSRRLQQFARRLLRDADEADDVTQEALLRVWQHAARWQPGRVQFTTWLFRIAQNQCIDRLRKAQTRREVSGSTRGTEAGENHDQAMSTGSANGSLLESLPDTRRGATPEERVSDADRARRLEHALGGLPERQRSALVLCFYQGLSNQQAADVLDVSVDALESLLARARRALRSALADLRSGADG